MKDIDNAEFICGKAEDTLKNIIHRFESEKVIAIVDPPRSGLRRFLMESISFLFYVFVSGIRFEGCSNIKKIEKLKYNHLRKLSSGTGNGKLCRVNSIQIIHHVVMISNVIIFQSFARAESKTYQYEPFVPVKTFAVDMFPHTTHR